jgi:putative hydrolase of the HAD superfamily
MSAPAPQRLPELGSLEAIITDVDGTLYDQRPVRRRMLSALLRAHLGDPWLGWRTVRCLRAFRSAQEEIRRGGQDHISHPDLQYAHAQRATGYPMEFVQQIVKRWMETEPLECLYAAIRPGMREFFDWASSRGIRLAALSDYPLEEKLKAMRVDPLFPVAVSASDRRILRFKPNPAILNFIIQELKASRERVIYLGDRPEVDGEVAKRVGVVGVILSPASERGWQDGLLFVQSFSELRQELEATTTLS